MSSGLPARIPPARRQHALAMALALAVGLAGCNAGPPAPTGSGAASPGAGGNCAGDLPQRTSPIDVPVAVLFVNGDDLPPVVGEVEWQGGDEPATYQPPRPIHLEPFTVLQTNGQSEVSMRMTDGVETEAWTVDAVPFAGFRAGDFETDRQRWSEGDAEAPTELVCVPIANGSWGIIADVTFADDAGSGTYVWRLIVTEVPDA